MGSFTIGGLAASGGVGVETVRYYQRRGLLIEPDRRNGIRRYDDADLRRLRFIRSAQTAGFTLEEIGELEGDFAPNFCRYYWAKFSDWSAGDNVIIATMSFTAALNDGTADYVAGDRVYEYHVIVAE